MITNLTAIANAAAEDSSVLDSGETLSAQQLADALDIGNKIWDNWSSEQIQAPVASSSTQSLLANNPLYAVGAAQTWAISPAPRRVTSASVQMSNGVVLPCRVVDSAEWDTIPDRSGSGNLITHLFYTPSVIDGQGIAQVSPVPQTNGATITMQFWKAFLQFPDTTTTIVIPAGYALAFEYELARALAAKFDVPWSQTNAGSLLEYMTRLRQLNAELWGKIAAGAPAQVAA